MSKDKLFYENISKILVNIAPKRGLKIQKDQAIQLLAKFISNKGEEKNGFLASVRNRIKAAQAGVYAEEVVSKTTNAIIFEKQTDIQILENSSQAVVNLKMNEFISNGERREILEILVQLAKEGTCSGQDSYNYVNFVAEQWDFEIPFKDLAPDVENLPGVMANNNVGPKLNSKNFFRPSVNTQISTMNVASFIAKLNEVEKGPYNPIENITDIAKDIFEEGDKEWSKRIFQKSLDYIKHGSDYYVFAKIIHETIDDIELIVRGFDQTLERFKDLAFDGDLESEYIASSLLDYIQDKSVLFRCLKILNHPYWQYNCPYWEENKTAGNVFNLGDFTEGSSYLMAGWSTVPEEYCLADANGEDIDPATYQLCRFFDNESDVLIKDGYDRGIRFSDDYKKIEEDELAPFENWTLNTKDGQSKTSLEFLNEFYPISPDKFFKSLRSRLSLQERIVAPPGDQELKIQVSGDMYEIYYAALSIPVKDELERAVGLSDQFESLGDLLNACFSLDDEGFLRNFGASFEKECPRFYSAIKATLSDGYGCMHDWLGVVHTTLAVENDSEISITVGSTELIKSFGRDILYTPECSLNPEEKNGIQEILKDLSGNCGFKKPESFDLLDGEVYSENVFWRFVYGIDGGSFSSSTQDVLFSHNDLAKIAAKTPVDFQVFGWRRFKGEVEAKLNVTNFDADKLWLFYNPEIEDWGYAIVDELFFNIAYYAGYGELNFNAISYRNIEFGADYGKPWPFECYAYADAIIENEAPKEISTDSSTNTVVKTKDEIIAEFISIIKEKLPGLSTFKNQPYGNIKLKHKCQVVVRVLKKDISVHFRSQGDLDPVLVENAIRGNKVQAIAKESEVDLVIYRGKKNSNYVIAEQLVPFESIDALREADFVERICGKLNVLLVLFTPLSEEI